MLVAPNVRLGSSRQSPGKSSITLPMFPPKVARYLCNYEGCQRIFEMATDEAAPGHLRVEA